MKWHNSPTCTGLLGQPKGMRGGVADLRRENILDAYVRQQQQQQQQHSVERQTKRGILKNLNRKLNRD
jgi:hypothetical protein